MHELSAATCVTAVEGLLWRAWPEEQSAAVYVPASGRTHLVSLLALAMLEHSSSKPRRLDELARTVFEAGQDELPSPPAAAEDHEHVVEAARGLIQAGLLHRAQCP